MTITPISKTIEGFEHCQCGDPPAGNGGMSETPEEDGFFSTVQISEDDRNSYPGFGEEAYLITVCC